MVIQTRSQTNGQTDEGTGLFLELLSHKKNNAPKKIYLLCGIEKLLFTLYFVLCTVHCINSLTLCFGAKIGFHQDKLRAIKCVHKARQTEARYRTPLVSQS